MDRETQRNLLDLVKTSYKQIAEDFDITRQKHLWPELLKLASQAKDGQSVLDVGCGNGRLLKAFQDRRINYVGVDSSEKLIEAAKKNFQYPMSNNHCHAELGSASYETGKQNQTLKQVQGDKRWQVQDDKKINKKFIVGDILELDKIKEKDFDLVFCIAVLHHLPGQDLQIKALEQLKNKIKPGGLPAQAGRIIITVWNLWSQKRFRRLILKFIWLKLAGKNHRLNGAGKLDIGDILFSWKNSQGEKVSQRYYHAFTKRGLRKIVKVAGLKIDRLDKDKYNYYLILK